MRIEQNKKIVDMLIKEIREKDKLLKEIKKNVNSERKEKSDKDKEK